MYLHAPLANAADDVRLGGCARSVLHLVTHFHTTHLRLRLDVESGITRQTNLEIPAEALGAQAPVLGHAPVDVNVSALGLELDAFRLDTAQVPLAAHGLSLHLVPGHPFRLELSAYRLESKAALHLLHPRPTAHAGKLHAAPASLDPEVAAHAHRP